MTTRFRLYVSCLAALAIFLFASGSALAASASEDQLLKAAQDSFNATFFDRAERQCAEFTQTFPTSAHLPDALLLQARSRLEQSNYAGAMQLLVASENIVGASKDEFVYWMGETRLREGNYREADTLFGRVVNESADSPRRVNASVKQAVARAKLGSWGEVIDLLGATGSAFQKEATEHPQADAVFQGYILLGEAYLNRSNYAAALSVIEPIGKRPTSDTNAWAWHFLRCRAQWRSGQMKAALDTTTNLIALASRAGVPALRGESAALRRDILAGLGRLDDAVIACASNLAPELPPPMQRDAVMKLTELSILRNQPEEGALILDKFTAQNSNAAAADAAWVKSGELRLRQYLEKPAASSPPDANGTNAIPSTNHLDQAIAAFQTAAKQFTNSPLLGTALSDLGWCFWFKGSMAECREAFAAALPHLPPGPERAKAQFKLADTLFRARDYALAMQNYDAVLKDFSASTNANLVEPALYQIVRAALAAGNIGAASNAVSRVLYEYPKGFRAEGAVLLFGQKIGNDVNPEMARELFEGYMRKDPDTALKPEFELAIARTYEQENEWPKAVNIYTDWLVSFTNHPAKAEAMFCRGQALFHAGDDTNAYSAFTNFVARYPKHPLAAQAQWNVADYYYNAEAYQKAEYEFQLIEHNWPGTSMAYEALMMAGRAAFRRQGWSEANVYFYDKVAMQTNCPADLRFRALFAYGDTLMEQVSTNKPEDYRKAAAAFDAICQQYPTNRLAALACGEKAMCFLQLARTGDDLTNAANAFKAVLTNTIYADGHAISIAKVGLGVVLEKRAATVSAPDQTRLRNEALDQYLDVLDGLYLKEDEGDEFWTKEAGIAAIRLASDMQAWEKVVKICQRMAEKLPQISPAFEEQKRKAIDYLSRARVASDRGERFDSQ